MQTEVETEQSNVAIATWKPENRPEQSLAWLIDAVTLLAESFGEPLTAQRLEIYARELADLSTESLRSAFRRAQRGLKFFPKIAELRELAGSKDEDARKVEAEAAWKLANDYLRMWGADLLAVYSAGKRIEAPALPGRIEYALRRIGGLRGLNQITEKSRPFMFKDFVEAYNLAPMAESLAPQLAENLCARKLLGEVKEQISARSVSEKPSEAKPVQDRAFPSKTIPAPPTDAQIRDRREMLRQQADRFRSADISSLQVEPRHPNSTSIDAGECRHITP